ncbi:MAG: Ger(x)C family spore germination protein [Firmicutes bacterium]|nr:Ger(x)C family spore germination protein [Bacillota bacterium]
MKLKLTLILLILIVVFGTGCWSSYELEDLALVSAVGIDYEDNKYYLTIQIIRPEKIAQTSSENVTTTIYTSGATIFDAIRNASSYLSHKLYWGYLQIAIFSEDSLDKGLAVLTDCFIRDFEVRPIISIAVTEKKARELLKAKVALEDISGEGLNALFVTKQSLSKYVHTRFKEVTVSLSNEGKDFACTLLGTRYVKDETFIEDKGTSLFRRETFVGNIDTLTSRGLLWLMGQIEGGLIVIENSEVESATLEITSASTKIKTKVENSKVSYEVNIKVVSNLGEQTGAIDPTIPKHWTNLTTAQAHHVQKEAAKALATIRELGSDPVGFGRLLRAFHPSIWFEIRDNWLEFYQTVPITINVNSTLMTSGMNLGSVTIYGSLD